MGAKESKSDQDYKKLLEQYAFKSKVQDWSFGEGQLLQEKLSKELVILKEITNTHIEDHQKQLKNFQAKQRLNHPNLLSLLTMTQKNEIQFCSTFYKTYLLFEYQENKLNLEISKRIQTNHSFSEEELWNLIENLVSGLSHLQQNNISHGDLKPSNIFITTAGIYKIDDQALFNPNSSYTLLLQNSETQTKEIYISPQLFKALEESQLKPNHNVYKSDVYSLGMIILYAATFQTSEHLYNFEIFKINHCELQQRIYDLSSKYSYVLREFLQNMLKEDENIRPDFIGLAEILKSDESIKFYRSRKAFSNNLNSFDQNRNARKETEFPSLYSDQQWKIENQEKAKKNASNNISEIKIGADDPYRHQKQNQQTGQYQASLTQTDINDLLKKYGIQPLKSSNFQDLNGNDYQRKNSYYTNNNYFQSELNRDQYHQPLGSNYESKQVYGDYKANQYSVDYKPFSSFNQFQSTHVQDSKPMDYQQDQQKSSLQQQQKNSLIDYNVPLTQPYKNKNVDEIINSIKKRQECSQKEYQTSNFGKGSEELQWTSEQQQFGQNSDLVYKNNVICYEKEVEKDRQGVPKCTNKDSFNANIGLKKEFSQHLEQNKSYGINREFYGGEGNYRQSDFIQMNEFSSFKNDKICPQEYKNIKNSPQESRISQNCQILNQSQRHNEQTEFVIENYQNGSIYQGEKLNEHRHGRGKFYYADGGIYDGDWYESKMHGKGVLYYASGQPAYDGDWNNDKFEGRGILYNEVAEPLDEDFDYTDFDKIDEFWLKYEGEFFDDNKEGQGALFLTNGERFVGNFCQDAVTGQGAYYQRNGNVVHGTWEDNKFLY